MCARVIVAEPSALLALRVLISIAEHQRNQLEQTLHSPQRLQGIPKQSVWAQSRQARAAIASAQAAARLVREARVSAVVIPMQARAPLRAGRTAIVRAQRLRCLGAGQSRTFVTGNPCP